MRQQLCAAGVIPTPPVSVIKRSIVPISTSKRQNCPTELGWWNVRPSEKRMSQTKGGQRTKYKQTVAANWTGWAIRARTLKQNGWLNFRNFKKEQGERPEGCGSFIFRSFSPMRHQHAIWGPPLSHRLTP